MNVWSFDLIINELMNKIYD